MYRKKYDFSMYYSSDMGDLQNEVKENFEELENRLISLEQSVPPQDSTIGNKNYLNRLEYYADAFTTRVERYNELYKKLKSEQKEITTLKETITRLSKENSDKDKQIEKLEYNKKIDKLIEDIIDPNIPEGEIYFKQKGNTVGKIVDSLGTYFEIYIEKLKYAVSEPIYRRFCYLETENQSLKAGNESLKLSLQQANDRNRDLQRKENDRNNYVNIIQEKNNKIKELQEELLKTSTYRMISLQDENKVLKNKLTIIKDMFDFDEEY